MSKNKKITKQQIVDELIQANELCRTMYHIAERGGIETNWKTFKAQLEKSLETQHKMLYAPNLY